MTFCTITSTGACITVMHHWWCHWYHVMLQPMVSHDQKSHTASHFNHLDLRNAMVPLMTPSASLDATDIANSITWRKGHVAPHFDHQDLRNAMVALMMHWHHMTLRQQWHHMTKKSCCTSFQFSGHNKWNGSIDNAVSMMWCQCYC